MAQFKWSGTTAGADWLVDRINLLDGGHYATGEVINSDSIMGTNRLMLDTISNYLTVYPGQTIVKADGEWQIFDQEKES